MTPRASGGGQEYVIDGIPVSGKNHTEIAVNRKTGKRFVKIGKVAAAWQADAIRQLTEQRTTGRRATMEGRVYVEYVAYQPWDKCDIDNIESALFDALKKSLAIRDDKHIWDHRGRKAIDPDRPRIEVTITPLSSSTTSTEHGLHNAEHRTPIVPTLAPP